MSKNITAIKAAGHVLAVAGLILALLEMTGLLVDDDKKSFYQQLTKELQVLPTHPGAHKFMTDFIFKRNRYLDLAPEKIERITVDALGLSRRDQYGQDRTELMSAYVVVQRKDQKQTTHLCSVEELRAWAEGSGVWKWIAWAMMAFGILLEIVVFYVEDISEKKSGATK
jgi:hypothetical protein